jgi:hypothetical protein
MIVADVADDDDDDVDDDDVDDDDVVDDENRCLGAGLNQPSCQLW